MSIRPAFCENFSRFVFVLISSMVVQSHDKFIQVNQLINTYKLIDKYYP